MSFLNSTSFSFAFESDSDNLFSKLINNDFYFFSVYDGHGGNGCSIFLRDFLHTYIKTFSPQGIKDAIEEAEEM